VSTEALKSVCEDFELSIDIEELVSLYDEDKSGLIDFEEFSHMLSDENETKRKPY
jgi:Ca2+-binding EF-hand superfamily protein